VEITLDEENYTHFKQTEEVMLRLPAFVVLNLCLVLISRSWLPLRPTIVVNP